MILKKKEIKYKSYKYSHKIKYKKKKFKQSGVLQWKFHTRTSNTLPYRIEIQSLNFRQKYTYVAKFKLAKPSLEINQKKTCSIIYFIMYIYTYIFFIKYSYYLLLNICAHFFLIIFLFMLTTQYIYAYIYTNAYMRI